jgi:hypothetical protein
MRRAIAVFLCPICEGTGVDEMHHGELYRCDRCHRIYNIDTADRRRGPGGPRIQQQEKSET